MKQIASILLLCLLLFNWGGYRVLFYWAEQQTNNRLELKLDKNDYLESDLIELSVPLNLPYQNDWANFERADGEIVINNVPYHYVKLKVKNNYLIIKCIPNLEKKYILNGQEDFFKSINGIQQNGAEKEAVNASEKLSFNINYYKSQNFLQLDFCGNCQQIKHKTYHNGNFETTDFFNAPFQPPEITPS